MDFQTIVKLKLTDLPSLKSVWDGDSVTAQHKSGYGFSASIILDDNEYLIHAGTGHCHWHYQSQEDALNTFFHLLSDSCRFMIVTSEGGRIHRMSIDEKAETSEWSSLSSSKMIFAPFWRKTITEYLYQCGKQIIELKIDKKSMIQQRISAKGEYTHVFHYDPIQLSYTYSIPGIFWQSSQKDLFQNENLTVRVGIYPYSPIIIQKHPGSNSMERAVDLFKQTYELIADKSIDVRVQELSDRHSSTIKCSSEFEIFIEGESSLARAVKYFSEISDGWVAQLTVEAEKDVEDSIADDILSSLYTTTATEGFDKFINSHERDN